VDCPVKAAAWRTSRVTLFLKFVHLAAISIWSGGLLALPYLFRQRRLLEPGPDFDRLHRLARFVYVETTSPAAFVAIASGTCLIFAQATFEEWFSLKMVLVAVMVMLHVVAGLVLLHLFAPEGHFGRFAYLTLTSAYVVVISAILWIVLAKPNISSTGFAARLFEPGGLSRVVHQSFGETRMPMP
jgi:protoporphyrinogen IX oxidase